LDRVSSLAELAYFGEGTDEQFFQFVGKALLKILRVGAFMDKIPTDKNSLQTV